MAFREPRRVSFGIFGENAGPIVEFLTKTACLGALLIKRERQRDDGHSGNQ